MNSLTHSSFGSKEIALLAISLMLVVLVSLPSNGTILVVEDHAHSQQTQMQHAHQSSLGYQTSCDDRSSIHCGAKLAVGNQIAAPHFRKIRLGYTQASLFALFARVIGQEPPPPRND